MAAFEEYWDFKAKRWVRTPGQEEALKKELGRIDSREWKDPEDIYKESERNRLENKHATYGGYDEAVAKALYREEHGYSDWKEQLERDIKAADEKNESKRKPL